MLNDIVSLLIGNKKISGWKSVSIDRSLDALADSFSMSFVDSWQSEPSPIVPYKKCILAIEKNTVKGSIKEQVLQGFIDSVNIKTESNQISVSTTGRSKTGDLVDCSAEFLPSNSWNNTPFTTIVRDLLNSYDVDLDFVSSSVFEKNKNLSFTINSGESIFEIIDRECKKYGILPVTNPYGNLELITSGDRVSQDKLILGKNILSAEVSYDYTNRYSLYYVKGQKSGGGGAWKGNTELSGYAFDTVFGDRYRNKIIVLDGSGTNELSQKTAEWEAQIRAGKCGKLTVRIPSWFQSNNSLWEVGTLVYCEVPPLKIGEQLLINSINFSQDNSGTICTLTLVNKDTFLSDPGVSVTSKIVKGSKKTGFGYGW